MKRKILLLFFGMLLTYCLSAQHYWEDNYPWDASGYTEWAAVADSFQVSLSVDSAWKATELRGLTNSTITTVGKEWFVGSGNRYSLALFEQNLLVSFNPSKDKESSFNFNSFILEENPNNVSFYGYSYLRGYYVDMEPYKDGIDNSKISGDVLIPSSLKEIYTDSSFLIKISVFDAHGHEWNAGGDPIDTISSNDFGVWTRFEIDYDMFVEGWGNIEENPGDGYSSTFHYAKRPIPGNDSTRAPIDFTKIVGLRFYLCPDVNYPSTSIDGSVVKFRNLSIGNTTDGSGIELYSHGAPPCLCGWSVTEIFNNPSVVSIELINLLGQTIATVKSMDEVTLKGVAILKVLYDDDSVEIVKIAK